MIDLTNKCLPNTLEVEGKLFLIYTDFRKWIQFGEAVHNNDTIDKALCIAKDNIPIEYLEEYMKKAIEFYVAKNETPNFNGGNDEQVVDFIKDGAYIYGSFMSAYGIDLTEVEMHWHKFKALFDSLPNDCKICEIMAHRGYKKSKKTQEQIEKELQKAWRLPHNYTEEEKRAIDEFNSL